MTTTTTTTTKSSDRPMIDYDAPLFALRSRDRIRPCHHRSTASVPFLWESVPGQALPLPSSSASSPPPTTSNSSAAASSLRILLPSSSSSSSSSSSGSAHHSDSPPKSSSARFSRHLLIFHRFLPAAHAVAANASPSSLRAGRDAASPPLRCYRPACHGRDVAGSSNSPRLDVATFQPDGHYGRDVDSRASHYSSCASPCEPHRQYGRDVDGPAGLPQFQHSRHDDMAHPTWPPHSHYHDPSPYSFRGRDMATWSPMTPSPCMLCGHDLPTSMSWKPCPCILSRRQPHLHLRHYGRNLAGSNGLPQFQHSGHDGMAHPTWPSHSHYYDPSPHSFYGRDMAIWTPTRPSPCMLCGHDLATSMSWKPSPCILSRRPPDPTPSKPSSSPSSIYRSSQDDSTPVAPSPCMYPFPQEPECDLHHACLDDDDDDDDDEDDLAPCLRVSGFCILPFHSSCFPLRASWPHMSPHRHKGTHLKSPQHCLPIPSKGGLNLHVANVVSYVKVKTKNCVTCLRRMEPSNGLRQSKLSKTIFNLHQDKSKESIGNLQQNSDHRNLPHHIQTSESIFKSHRVTNQDIIRSNERNKTEFGIDFPMRKHVPIDVEGPALPSSPAHSWLEKAIPLLPSRSYFASYMLNKEKDRIISS